MPKRTAEDASLSLLAELPDELNAEEAKRLIDQAEEALSERREPLNKFTLKRVVGQFERRLKKNQELRIQHPDDPEKFLKSEVDLDEEVKKFKPLAVAPELLNDFASLNGLQLLVGLLGHANTDIAIEVIDVLSDITDPDNIVEADDPQAFIDELLKLGLPQILVDTLLRIKEDESDEDYKAATNILQILENFADVKPDLCETYAKNTRLVQWLVQRLRHCIPSKQPMKQAAANEATRPFHADPNRLYASEILSIILQNSHTCRIWMTRRDGLDGIDRLLRSISVYRKRNPLCADEEEFISNNFSCLCSLLLVPANQTLFGQSQGLELTIRMMKERNYAYHLALKLTSFALQHHAANCKTFVEKMGLKSLFGILMHKGVTVEPNSAEEKADDEHLTSILNSLTRYCTDSHLARVVNKFTESGCEKLERILEIHDKYHSVLKTPLHRMKDEQTIQINKDLAIDEDEIQYLERCDRGLCILQHIDLLLLRLVGLGNRMLRQKVFTLMLIKGVDIKEIDSSVREYVDHLDAAFGGEEKKSVMQSLTEFLDAWDNKDNIV